MPGSREPRLESAGGWLTTGSRAGTALPRIRPPRPCAGRQGSTAARSGISESAVSNRSAVHLRAATGAAASPRRCRRAPQKGWSARKGTTTAGSPARTTACTVPAPPWWTAATHRGRTSSCGTERRSSTSSPRRSSGTSMPPHPVVISVRSPARRAAVTTARPRAMGSPAAIEPKPAYNTSPASRNIRTSSSTCPSEWGAASNQGPVRTVVTGQPAGRGSSSGLTGTADRTGPGTAPRRGSPRSDRTSRRGPANAAAALDATR